MNGGANAAPGADRRLSYPYSPECAEGAFPNLRAYGVLGTLGHLKGATRERSRVCRVCAD